MNSYTRVLKCLKGEATDRPSFQPITMMFAADLIGVPYGEYATDFRKLVAGQLAVAEEFESDHVSVISDPAREAADCGAAIHFFDDQPPAMDESAAFLADKGRLAALPSPNPLRDGSRMRDRVEAVRLFAARVKGEKWIEGWVEGPCAEAADLRGINALMTDFIDDPDFVETLLDRCVETAIRFASAQLDAGADIIGIGDAAASLIGPRLYHNVVLPHERRLVEAIHGLGGRVRLHICGNMSRSLADIGSLKCDFVDLDSMVSMAAAREVMGPRQVLAGNIDPVATLCHGTPETIASAISVCQQLAGDAFIIAAGCEVPRSTPHANLHAMRKN